MNVQKRKKLKEYTKMLYIVDMVNGFVNEGILHDKHIQKIIPEQIKLIKKIIEEGEGLAFIKDCHTKNSLEFNDFLEHCLEGTTESILVPELLPYENESLVYYKNSTNAMFAPNMIEDLNTMENLEEVIAVGCCTDICVLNFLITLKTYFNQLNRDIKIIAIKNAMDTYHLKEIHEREEWTEIAYKLLQLNGILLVDDINKLLKTEEKMGLKKQKRRN